MMPVPTRCATCGTVAAEIVCHVCKTPRPPFERQFRLFDEIARQNANYRLAHNLPPLGPVGERHQLPMALHVAFWVGAKLWQFRHLKDKS